MRAEKIQFCVTRTATKWKISPPRKTALAGDGIRTGTTLPRRLVILIAMLTTGGVICFAQTRPNPDVGQI